MAWYDRQDWWSPRTAAPVVTTAPGGGNLPGRATDYNPAYGGKPAVPNPTVAANQAIAGNTANLGQIYNLAGKTNQFNEQELLQQLEAALPGYSHNVTQSSANIGNLLEGQLPPDVINQMAIRGAERGVNVGSPGSPNATAAYLAAIGRSSLDLTTQGEQELTGSIARTPRAPLYDPSRMFVTPEEEQAAMSAANLYASAPVPAAAAAERIRLAEAGGGGVNPGSTGGFMGVNRSGMGGGSSPLLTPYDQGGVVGGGPWAGGQTPYVSPTDRLPFVNAPEGSAYATNPNVPQGAMWNPTLGLYVDLTGQAFDQDGTPVGPAEGAQQAIEPSYYSDSAEATD